MSNLSGSGSSSGSDCNSGSSRSYTVRFLVLGAWLAGRYSKVGSRSSGSSVGLYRIANLTVLTLI